MKKKGKGRLITFLILIVLLWVSPASAVVVTDWSGNESSDGFVITPHPAWGMIPGVSWVSAIAGTGYNGVVLPNTTVASGVPTFSIIESFTLPYVINAGSVQVFADDTAAVWIYNSMHPSGFLLKAANPVQDLACAAGPIGCEPSESATIALGGHLVQGLNSLRFDDYQVDGGPTGLSWSLSINSTPVPEDNTMVLVILGAVAMLVGRLRLQSV